MKKGEERYRKDFEDRFGVKPLDDDEMLEIKAMLFEVGANNDGQRNLYDRYYRYYEEWRQKASNEHFEEYKRNEYYDEMATYVI